MRGQIFYEWWHQARYCFCIWLSYNCINNENIVNQGF
jgi:hypothetical protein